MRCKLYYFINWPNKKKTSDVKHVAKCLLFNHMKVISRMSTYHLK